MPINNKVYSMIIGGGSYVNITSTILIIKLNFNTTKHYKPYKLRLLNGYGEVKVYKQVLVSFFIGRYNDEVSCDVVSMHSCHLLLGRPW